MTDSCSWLIYAFSSIINDDCACLRYKRHIVVVDLFVDCLIDCIFEQMTGCNDDDVIRVRLAVSHEDLAFVSDLQELEGRL